jgi:hypothetical protein
MIKLPLSKEEGQIRFSSNFAFLLSFVGILIFSSLMNASGYATPAAEQAKATFRACNVMLLLVFCWIFILLILGIAFRRKMLRTTQFTLNVWFILTAAALVIPVFWPVSSRPTEITQYLQTKIVPTLAMLFSPNFGLRLLASFIHASVLCFPAYFFVKGFDVLKKS